MAGRQPDNLLPAPRRQQAADWVELSGGVGADPDPCPALAAAGDLRLACHLIEYAVQADPGSFEAHALRAEIYDARAEHQVSSMARNILRHAALSSEQGRLDLAGGT